MGINKLNQKMKCRVASYSMGICHMIRVEAGDGFLAKVLKGAARKSGERRAEQLKEEPDKAEALAKNLVSMVLEFGTEVAEIVKEGDSYIVNNPRCECLTPFTSQAETFGFSETEARRYACMRCMPSYKQTAETLGLDFKGKLTGGVDGGCFMQFIKRKNEQH